MKAFVVTRVGDAFPRLRAVRYPLQRIRAR